MTQVKYIHTKDLKPAEKDILKNIIEGELPKLERFVPDALELVVDVKTLKPEDQKTRRHILNLKFVTRQSGVFRTKIGESEMKRSGAYDLTLGCHKAMDNLQSELKHKLQRDVGLWKKLSEKMGFNKKAQE